MKRCCSCGVLLDGVQRQPHTLVVLQDGKATHSETYCLEHYDALCSWFRLIFALGEPDRHLRLVEDDLTVA